MEFDLYRITVANEEVGIVAVETTEAAKGVAGAFAQGKYGAGSSVEIIAIEAALNSNPVCEVMKTKQLRIEPGTRGKTVRVLA